MQRFGAALLVATAIALVSFHAQGNPAHHPPAGSAAMGSATSAPMGSATTAPMVSASAPMGSATSAPSATGPAGTAPGGGMGGMGGMMEGMMTPSSTPGCVGGDCGPAATTPIYPSLMTLPALTPEKRSEIDALATQQINEGMSRLAKGSESLNRATQAGDSAAMPSLICWVASASIWERFSGVRAGSVISDG